MTPKIVVLRWFPTYDFVVRTSLSREAAVEALMSAMEEPSTRNWPWPKPHLSGRVTDGTFRCRPRTSALGGNAVPSVAGEIVPRADGGTDVLVRVIEWFVFFLAGILVVFAVLGIVVSARAATASQILKGVALAAWMLLTGTALYVIEARFVRKIFARIFHT